MSVYFITCREVDLVKIGCAINPVSRFHHLLTSCPLELALEGAIPGGFEKERELHELYAKWRVRGEWFTITPSIEDAIAASTRPEKYTWASVRLWLKALADQDEEREQRTIPPSVREAFERDAQEALSTSRLGARA